MVTLAQIQSSLVHVFFAVVFQIICGIMTGDWILGALGASMFYLGREHAQHEYKLAGYIKVDRSIKDLKFWQGFDMLNWGLDSTMDWLLPMLATAVLAYILT